MSQGVQAIEGIRSTTTRAERERGASIAFNRIRRITGYISTVERFNTPKRKELRDRVKHDKP